MFSIKPANARVVGGLVAAAVVLGTGVGAQAATSAHKKITRKQTISYQGGCGVDGAVVVGALGTCAVGGNYTLKRRTGEKYLTISVADQTGRPVGGEIWLSSGTGNAVSEQFCGSLKNYQMGQSKYQLDLNTSINPSCPGAATSGKISIKYTNYK